MNLAIKNLRKTPGVIGGFVFNTQKGIVANSLPPSFRNIRLLEIGISLSGLYITGANAFNGAYELSVSYENTNIIIRKALEDYYLVLICEPQVDIRNLKSLLSAAMSHIAKRAGEDVKGVNIAEILETGPMSYTLNGMKTAMATVLGPFAKIIFMDAMNEWLNETQPSFTTLSKFIDILVREIKEPEKIRQFIELIIPYVEPDQKR